VLGRPPIRYLTDWRMYLAENLLATTGVWLRQPLSGLNVDGRRCAPSQCRRLLCRGPETAVCRYPRTGSVARMGMEIRFTKWGGRRHWRFSVEPLGTDQYGRWFGARAGILLQRGFEDPIVQPHDFIVLVPAKGCWIATWNDPGQTDISIYVDVTTEPSIHADVVSAVDLDLDVVRLRDGTVRVLDEDEFADHQTRYKYPADVVEQARATSDDLVARLTAGTEPFAAVGAAWLEKFIGSD
jgi:uncharacterized protein